MKLRLYKCQLYFMDHDLDVCWLVYARTKLQAEVWMVDQIAIDKHHKGSLAFDRFLPRKAALPKDHAAFYTYEIEEVTPPTVG